jgi:hypothetical protein
VKKAMALPIPVDNPANRVKRNAMRKLSVIVMYVTIVLFRKAQN